MASITLHDQSATGRELGSITLDQLPDTITLRELIRLRVREEVARHNAAPTTRFQGLVQPTDAEVDRNGYRLRTPRRLDWEKQADVAEQAFLRNGFFVLLDDRQAEDLDEVIAVDDALEVAFVKLVQLVGG